MASRGEVDLSPSIIDELSCCVCRELLREPKILGCGHTTCIECLANMVEFLITRDAVSSFRERVREVVRCPICRHCSDIPFSGIEEFPTNYIVKSLVQLNLGVDTEDVREIQTKITESKTLLEQVQNTSTSIDDTMKLVEDKKQTVISDINQVFDSLVEKLRHRQEQLTERCCSKAAKRLRDLRHLKQCTKAVECIMKKTIERVELSTGSSNVQQRKEAILAELSELEMFLVFNDQAELSDFKFVVEGEQEITDRISDLGNIHCAFDDSEQVVPVAVPTDIRGVDVIKVIDSYGNSSDDNEQSTLTLPWGVTITNTDNFIVADHHHNRVLQFDVEGNFLRHYAEEHDIRLPTGVAVSDEGNVLVLDTGNHCIKELNSSGDLVRCIGKSGSGLGEIGERAEGITVDHEGRFIVADTENNRVQVFHRNGGVALTFGNRGNESLSRPSCAVYHKGKFIVSDTQNHCLKFYNRYGLLIRQVGLPGKESGQFRHPRGLTVDGKDNILVCDSGNCRIQVLDFNGNFVTCFGSMGDEDGQFCFPYGIAINSRGAMIVTDCNNNRIQILRFKI